VTPPSSSTGGTGSGLPRRWTLADVTEADLLRAKRDGGHRVAVVIPALDEESHVGGVVSALMPLVAASLVDELVVVDGGSSDATARRAGDAGARVVQQSDVTVARGKGAALQAGVRVTTSSIVAFVDADVHEPHVGLVTGTIAPLLLGRGVRLVKADYRRPLREAAVGGGRVTELMVRPLLALCWPELVDLGQPLAGEYAADRELLESLPFEQGYGVELGLLLDTLRLHGRGAIAQNDLGVRAHEHQPLEALGVMAAEVLLVAADRLAAEGRTLPSTSVLRLPQAEVARRVLPPISVGPPPR
jgi:glucosyl-3-phosphoglycerate synthase